MVQCGMGGVAYNSNARARGGGAQWEGDWRRGSWTVGVEVELVGSGVVGPRDRGLGSWEHGGSWGRPAGELV